MIIDYPPPDPQFGARDELYHNLKDRIADIDAKLDKLVPVAELDERVATITAFAKMDLLKMRSAVAKDGAAHSKETDSKLDFSNSDKLFDIAAIYQYQKVENWLSLSRQAGAPDASEERKTEIEEATKSLDDFRAKTVPDTLKETRADPMFKGFKESLSLEQLNNAMKQQDGMLQAYNEYVQKTIQKQEQIDSCVSQMEEAARGRENQRFKLAIEEHTERMSMLDENGLKKEVRYNSIREMENSQKERRENVERQLYKDARKEHKHVKREFTRIGLNREERNRVFREMEEYVRDIRKSDENKLREMELSTNEIEFARNIQEKTEHVERMREIDAKMAKNPRKPSPWELLSHMYNGQNPHNKTAKAKDSNAPKPVQPTVPGMK